MFKSLAIHSKNDFMRNSLDEKQREIVKNILSGNPLKELADFARYFFGEHGEKYRAAVCGHYVDKRLPVLCYFGEGHCYKFFHGIDSGNIRYVEIKKYRNIDTFNDLEKGAILISGEPEDTYPNGARDEDNLFSHL
jgi:hypothetical protein